MAGEIKCKLAPSIESQTLERTTTTMNNTAGVLPAAPAKNVTVAVNYELPMVDQFMKVERKRRSSTHSTGLASSTTISSNPNSGGAGESNKNPDEHENVPEQQHQRQPTRSPPGRRVSVRDKQKRSTPVSRSRVRYNLQLVPVVRRNQAFLDGFESWWTKVNPATPPTKIRGGATTAAATRRSNRLLATGGAAVEADGPPDPEQCQCTTASFPFLEDTSVLWIPANRSQWEDTVSEMTAVCTQAALRRHTDKTKPLVPPLSRDYIRDRIDIDDPLRGYQLRHKYGGWLQGFVLYTNFTTWTHGFHWDSKHPKSGFPVDDGVDHPNMDMDGSLAAELEEEPRAGDPRGGGIVFSSLAEIGLLGGLGCGEYMLRMALTDIWKNTKYKYVVLQATEQSKEFYELFGFVRVGAICQYGRSEKPKVAGRKWRRTSNTEDQKPTLSPVPVFAPECDGSKSVHPATATAPTTSSDDAPTSLLPPALPGDPELPSISEVSDEQPYAAVEMGEFQVDLQDVNMPTANESATYSDVLEDVMETEERRRRSVTKLLPPALPGDGELPPISEVSDDQRYAAVETGEFKVELQDVNKSTANEGTTCTEILEDVMETEERGRRSVTFEMDRESSCDASWDPLASELGTPHTTVQEQPALPAAHADLECRSMSHEVKHVAEPAISSVGEAKRNGEHTAAKAIPELQSRNTERLPASSAEIVQHLPKEKISSNIGREGDLEKPPTALLDTTQHSTEEKKDDDFPIDAVAPFSEIEHLCIDSDCSSSEHATTIQQQTQHGLADKKTAEGSEATSSTVIAQDCAVVQQISASPAVLTVDSEMDKRPEHVEAGEAFAPQKQEGSCAEESKMSKEQKSIGSDKQHHVEGFVSDTIAPPPSAAAAAPSPALTGSTIFPAIDFTNMPVVGYRHWTHANESERSLQKHGGPSYMMCLKLPERASSRSVEELVECHQCGGSQPKADDMSFTDQMLAILGVERKPRVENLGASSTPGGLKFARRSMSMPLETNFSSRSFDANSGNLSPRGGKTLARIGLDSTRIADAASPLTTIITAKPKNNGSTDLLSKTALIQSKAVRVAKMPKRSHSMAEIESQFPKRQKIEEIIRDNKPPAKKSTPAPQSEMVKPEANTSATKVRERARTPKSAIDVRPPPPQNGQPLSYAQKQYHSVWLAVPPENPLTVASPIPQRAHPLERAALAAVAAAKSPTRERRPSASSSTVQAPTATTAKRKVGRPPSKIGRPVKKSSTAKSFRSSTAKSTKLKAKKSSKTTMTTDNGRVFHSVRGPDGKFIRVEVKKVGRPPKAKVGRPPKDKPASFSPKRKAPEVILSTKKNTSTAPHSAAAPPTDHQSLFDLVKSGKPQTIDPKSLRKQKVLAFSREKHHYYNKIVRRKRGSPEKFFYVLEYDDERNLLCIVPMYTKGALGGQREGRPRYRCDIGETDANFKIVSGADYAVVRSCAIMKTAVVAMEAWDVETEDDENFVTRTS